MEERRVREWGTGKSVDKAGGGVKWIDGGGR